MPDPNGFENLKFPDQQIPYRTAHTQAKHWRKTSKSVVIRYTGGAGDCIYISYSHTVLIERLILGKK